MADKDNSDPAYATLEQLMAIEERVTLLEQRLARIEGILEQMDKRIDDMNRRIDELKGDLRWFMGISIGIWVSIVIPMLLRFLGVI